MGRRVRESLRSAKDQPAEVPEVGKRRGEEVQDGAEQ